MNKQNTKIAAVYTFDEFRFDVADRAVYTSDGQRHALKARAFETLLYLVENPGRVIERDEIMTAVWPDTVVEENNLTQHISSLRRLFGDTPDDHQFIETVPGRGYRFVAGVGKQIINEGNGTIREKSLSEADARSEPDRRDSKTNRRESRFLFFVFATLILGALVSLGFLLSGERPKPASDLPFKAIAILPFRPLVPSERNESLELGITNNLIDKLNSSGEIAVRPLSSVRGFTKEDLDVQAIGRDLGVDAVLEGYIQVVGEKIRVTVRLTGTKEGRQLWNEPFNDDFTDTIVAEDTICEKVADAVRPQLTANAKKRLTKDGTKNPQAHLLYITGRYHILKGILPETQKGISFLKQAIELDPNYALAYAELANAYRTQALSSDIPANEVLPLAKEAALEALEIDDTLAEAHVMAGHAAMWFDRNWEEAEKQANRALELEPNNADAIYLLENLYSFLGRHDEAIALGQKARELDPLSLFYYSVEAQTLLYAGRVDEAFEWATKARDLDDNFWHVHFILARIYTEKGMYQDAITEADRAAQISGRHSYALAVKGYALARSGETIEARRIVDELVKRTDNARHYTNIALVYTGLGDKEKALEHLEKGFEGREAQLELKVAPAWEDLRSEPRFIAILRKMNMNY